MRVERPHSPYFRYTGPGQLTAKEAANLPTTATGRFVARVKAVVLGKPLSSESESEERLSKKKALAIFSSDAISSSAYATEEIIRAFMLAGAAMLAFDLAIEVALAIAILLGVVAFSYRQVCVAYPTGGGSYSVSKVNFGRLASLVAAFLGSGGLNAGTPVAIASVPVNATAPAAKARRRSSAPTDSVVFAAASIASGEACV